MQCVEMDELRNGLTVPAPQYKGDDRVKFKVEKTSNWGYQAEVEINTIEELIKFIKDNGSKIIICEDNTIEIYDTYRE